jgi:hypothetical protein
METIQSVGLADSHVEPEIWLSQAANLLNLYVHGYCPKDVAKGLLQKIAVNWPNMLDDVSQPE